jgi:hypothetical protein
MNYRIGYLVVTLCISAVLLALYLVWREQVPAGNNAGLNQPVNWKPFSEQAKNEALESGKKVIVFVFAELSPESEIGLQRIDQKKIREFCGDFGYEPLLLRYSDWNDPAIRSVWQDVGHTKQPMLILYTPGEEPKVYDPITLVPRLNERQPQR